MHGLRLNKFNPSVCHLLFGSIAWKNLNRRAPHQQAAAAAHVLPYPAHLAQALLVLPRQRGVAQGRLLELPHRPRERRPVAVVQRALVLNALLAEGAAEGGQRGIVGLLALSARHALGGGGLGAEGWGRV